MKKILVLLLTIIIISSALISCADTSNSSGGSNGGAHEHNVTNALVVGEDALTFDTNGVKITPNAKAASILEALGEPLDYTESQSCAFPGKDRTYKYNGFIIQTIEDETGEEYIYFIELKSDLVSTPEGAYINMTLKEIQDIYKDKYEMVDGHVVIRFTGGNMRCFIKNGVCKSITYESTYEGSAEN